MLRGRLFCGVAVRTRLVPGIALALLVSVGGAHAAEEPGAVPALARESSSIKPAAERQLGAQARPTIKKRAEAKADTNRAIRVSLQIPEALRATLAKRIDRRIARNVAASKKLRHEAHALLEKFIQESPEDSSELPEALIRIGELEWEEARDRFL